MRRISKKVREEAAFLCALCASGRSFGTHVEFAAYWIGLPDDPGIICGSPSACLAFRAICFVELTETHARAGGWSRANAAEAEALLRTGWTP